MSSRSLSQSRVVDVVWRLVFSLIIVALHVEFRDPSCRATTSWFVLADSYYGQAQQQCDNIDDGGRNMRKKKSKNRLHDPTNNDRASESSRRMASIGQVMTNPTMTTKSTADRTILRRRNYPESQPHVCLAFLSCCNRIDLLNHTIAGAIRHLELDEPKELRYEIAWVDNGSDQDLTSKIISTYEIEHALLLPQNMGLAYGMNLLIHNLCQAPYILLLEEDWLYLDELVAPQTPERRRAIATSVALLESFEEQDIRAYDYRQIFGVFLRHETYDSFLKFPHADAWETHTIESDFSKTLPQSSGGGIIVNHDEQGEATKSHDGITGKFLEVDYRVFCADTGLQGDSIWGSYTNGAGLYRRRDLIEGVGRMYGEPGDPFHDRYVEGNYAFRAGLFYCHAAIRLTSDRNCRNIADPSCAGGFHHIGSGRSTRPRTAEGTSCADPTWNFYGTPLYDKYHQMVAMANGGQRIEICSPEQLEEIRAVKFRDMDAQEYREQIARDNEKVFEEERKERDKIRLQARAILNLLDQDSVDVIKSQVPWMADMTREEIKNTADRMLRLMDSPHPMKGFWDSHGRIIDREKASAKKF